MRPLNERQKKFVEAYFANGGNGLRAAREAGYDGSDRTLAVTASRILQLESVVHALQVFAENDPGIATRSDRMRFYTEVMNSPAEDMRDRLKAAELLGKTQGDFMDVNVIFGRMELEDLRALVMAKLQDGKTVDAVFPEEP